MQQALETLPRYQAKQQPDLDIASRLQAQYTQKLQAAIQNDAAGLWDKHVAQLSASYTSDLKEYNERAAFLLGYLDKALADNKPNIEMGMRRNESPMKEMALEDFITLLRYKDYPVVLRDTEGSEYDPDTRSYDRFPMVVLTTPLR